MGVKLVALLFVVIGVETVLDLLIDLVELSKAIKFCFR
ncbi:Uncharacterised protein [Chlamydia trachomatis]|nr:Uncharacterised protein [Chlamydia trachomatis]